MNIWCDHGLVGWECRECSRPGNSWELPKGTVVGVYQCVDCLEMTVERNCSNYASGKCSGRATYGCIDFEGWPGVPVWDAWQHYYENLQKRAPTVGA